MIRFKTHILPWLKIALLVYIFITLAAFVLQSHLLFQPTEKTRPPSFYGLKDFNQTIIRTDDNIKLTAWFHHSPGNEKTILYFYGQADTLTNYPSFFQRFAANGYNALAINYRGYGGSKGHPSEAGFYLDGNAALKFLSRYINPKNIIVVGRSLGTGVAVEVAAHNEVGGLVLISPYTTINAVASRIYWYLPVKYISRYKFDSLEKIKSITTPTLIIHGEADSLIPYSQAEELDKASKAPRHQLIKYTGAGHVDLDKLRIADDIMKFFAEPNADQ